MVDVEIFYVFYVGGLCVDEEFVGVGGFLVYCIVEWLFFGVGIVEVIFVVFVGVIDLISEFVGYWFICVYVLMIGFVRIDGGISVWFLLIEEWVFSDEIYEVVDICWDVLNCGGGFFYDVDGFDWIKIDWYVVFIVGDLFVYFVYEYIGWLVLDVGIFWCVEICLCVGVGSEFGEIVYILDVDCVELFMGDDGDVVWCCYDVVGGVKYGVEWMWGW